MGFLREYGIAFVDEDASLDEAVARVQSRGVVVFHLYRGLHWYAFCVTEEGNELSIVYVDPATQGLAEFGQSAPHELDSSLLARDLPAAGGWRFAIGGQSTHPCEPPPSTPQDR